MFYTYSRFSEMFSIILFQYPDYENKYVFVIL